MIFAFLGLVVIYCFVIYNTKSGRCFRYEYIIKVLIIIFLSIFCIGIGAIISPPLPPSVHTSLQGSSSEILILLLMFFLLYYYWKITIKRLYDLNLSKWFILLAIIPTINILLTLYLFVKKGNCEINKYDKAIDYKKIIKDKHFIDIHESHFLVNGEENKYELNSDKYIIKIPKKQKENIFTDYLLINYLVKETQTDKTVEISNDELKNIIINLGLIEIINSFYIKIKKLEIFVRNENFKYTIIVNKNNIDYSKELLEKFDFPGSYFEDKKYIYYDKIDNNNLVKWVKNVA
jgi:uncharacterized membrane protein YhaH (DUF805 family)